MGFEGTSHLRALASSYDPLSLSVNNTPSSVMLSRITMSIHSKSRKISYGIPQGPACHISHVRQIFRGNSIDNKLSEERKCGRSTHLQGMYQDFHDFDCAIFRWQSSGPWRRVSAPERFDRSATEGEEDNSGS